MSELCPLCATAALFFEVAARRHFFRCPACALVFVSRAELPGEAAERARYETHRNTLGDAGYVAFLERAVRPIVARVPAGSHGLDFGAGPGPVLAELLRRRGLEVAIYDPFFHPDRAALARTYDFVTCTETVEHFHDPGASWGELARLVRPGGWLVVMTQLVDERATFEGWHYARDPTHVVFYSPATCAWIARRFGWEEERVDRDVVLFRC